MRVQAIPGTHDHILGTLGRHRTQGRVDLKKEAHGHRAPRKYGIAALGVLGLDILPTAVCSPLSHSAALGRRNNIVRVQSPDPPGPPALPLPGVVSLDYGGGTNSPPGLLTERTRSQNGMVLQIFQHRESMPASQSTMFFHEVP